MRGPRRRVDEEGSRAQRARRGADGPRRPRSVPSTRLRSSRDGALPVRAPRRGPAARPRFPATAPFRRDRAAPVAGERLAVARIGPRTRGRRRRLAGSWAATVRGLPAHLHRPSGAAPYPGGPSCPGPRRARSNGRRSGGRRSCRSPRVDRVAHPRRRLGTGLSTGSVPTPDPSQRALAGPPTARPRLQPFEGRDGTGETAWASCRRSSGAEPPPGCARVAVGARCVACRTAHATGKTPAVRLRRSAGRSAPGAPRVRPVAEFRSDGLVLGRPGCALPHRPCSPSARYRPWGSARVPARGRRSSRRAPREGERRRATTRLRSALCR